MSQIQDITFNIARLTEIGIALSKEDLSEEENLTKLLEMILIGAKELTHAQGGTIYSVNQEDRTVKMEIVRNDKLPDFEMGGTTGKPIPFPPIPLYDEHGIANHGMVVTHAVLNDSTINIPDAYHAEGFDFSGTKAFDAKTGYHSTSFLTVPMKNHKNDIIGVIQLINATDCKTGEIVPFSSSCQLLCESLASQAAIALTNNKLISDLNELLEALIQLIATAIDEKSPYTGGHCSRVPELTMLLAQKAAESSAKPFSKFSMDENDIYELHIASWLHDCGKITTPEYVVDKSTKLETIYDRIHTIENRFEILKRDAEIAVLQQRIAAMKQGKPDPEPELSAILQQQLQAIDEELHFLQKCNSGGEFMAESDQNRVLQISRHKLALKYPQPDIYLQEYADLSEVGNVLDNFRKKHGPVSSSILFIRSPSQHDNLIVAGFNDADKFISFSVAAVDSSIVALLHTKSIAADGTVADLNSSDKRYIIEVASNYLQRTKTCLLSDTEIYNLTISKGTLTPEERQIINHHIVATINMLKSLPFPKHLSRVPEYAGGHHERMDGKGYPNGLYGHQMSLQARAMAIADIFEALTAPDRPYKPGKKLSESLRILGFMAGEGHIDRDLFHLFIEEKVYMEYADRFMDPSQVDEIDVTKIPNFVPGSLH